MSFDEQFSSFAVNVGNWSNDTIRSVTHEIAERIVNRTPVADIEEVDDPGQAKGNWQGSIGAPSTGTIDNPDESGVNTIAALDAKIKEWNPSTGESFFITNNVIYVPVLEYGLYPSRNGGRTPRTVNGYSTQAPYGMVGITVAEFGGVFNGFIKESL